MAVMEAKVEKVVEQTVYMTSDGREHKDRTAASAHEYSLALAELFPGKEAGIRAAAIKLYTKYPNHQGFLIRLADEVKAAASVSTAA